MTTSEALWKAYQALASQTSDDEAQQAAIVINEMINEIARRNLAMKDIAEMSVKASPVTA